MKMASSGSEKLAVVQYGYHGPAAKVYRFQILLPNGTSTSVKLRDPGEEMPLPDFLHRIREGLGHASAHGGERRGIEWDGDVYLEDLLDRKIDKKVQFSDFVTKGTNILRLQVSPQLYHVLIHEVTADYLIPFLSFFPFVFLGW